MNLLIILTVYLLLCAVIIYIILLLRKLIRFRNIINKYPGKKSVIFLGDVINFSLQRDKLFLQFREYAKLFPTGYKLWGGFYGSFNFLQAEDYESILSSIKHIKKKGVYLPLESWLGSGLLTSSGLKWQQRRKILTPTFHFNILKRFVTIFGEHNELFVEQLEQECKKEKTEITPLITNLTLNLICETAMGIKLESGNEKQEKYRTAIKNVGRLIVEKVFQPWFYYDCIYYLSPSGRKFKKYLKTLHEFTDEVIKKREQLFEESDLKVFDEESDENEIYYGKKRFAMLDLLISTKKNGQIDDKGIREEVDTFMFEGHDTTSSALCFALFSLSHYKDIQKKVQNEIDNIFQGSKRRATFDDLQNMNYMELFIKECLRMYPSVPVISRTITQDTLIRDGKYLVPRGCLTFLQIYDLHRDPRSFPDPEKFDPDRFLPENCKSRHPYSYVPFSAGPRNCIGQRFAMLELKSVISSILRYYDIDPVDKLEDLQLVTDLILRSKDNINVKFKIRQK